MGPGGLATPNRAGVCGRPPTNRPLLAVREDGGVYSPSLRSRAVRLPPTPCRVCFRPCVFNKFSHFWQKRTLCTDKGFLLSVRRLKPAYFISIRTRRPLGRSRARARPLFTDRRNRSPPRSAASCPTSCRPFPSFRGRRSPRPSRRRRRAYRPATARG